MVRTRSRFEWSNSGNFAGISSWFRIVGPPRWLFAYHIMFAVFSYYSRKTGLSKILVHLANGSPFKKRFFNLPMKSPGSNFDSGDRKGNVNGSAHSKDYLTAWARDLWSTRTTSPALFTLLAAGEREDLWHSGYFIGRAVVKTLCLITLLMLTDLHNSNLQGELFKG